MSPQQKRSSQYDWFKGTPANGRKKTPKENAKTVWKFTKIFIYLALFVFSMTGCIQTLVIKTQNSVGRGVEFYSSESEVAPHVTTVNVTKDVNGIYTVAYGEENYWLSKDTKQADGSTSSLESVHNAVMAQNEHGNLKLSDAFKGSNEAIQLKFNDLNTPKPDADYGVAIGASGKAPLVLSSLATKSAFNNFNFATDKNTLDGIVIYTNNDASGAVAAWSETTLKDSLYSYEKDYIRQIANQFKGVKDASDNELDTSSITSTVTVADAQVAANTLADSASTPSIATNVKNKVSNIVDNFTTNKVRDEVRQAYTLEVIKTILSDNEFKTWMSTKVDITKATAADPKITTINELMNSVSTDADVVAAQKEVMAKNAAFGQITKITGLALNGQTINGGFHFTAGVYPFFGGSTDWRPLVTWGDAWGEGPFYGIFVYPVAYVAANMIDSMPIISGWETLISIFVVVFLLRMITFALSFKSIMQQTKMQELASKKAVIDAKYAAYKGNKQMENRQRQEVSEMYKKEGVSMFGSISTIFLTMPFFLAIWRTIGALPHIKSTIWLGINFSATSYKELFAGEWQYLPLMLIAAGFAAFQQILPRLLTRRRDKNRINVHQKAAMKKNNKTQNIMVIVFVFMSLIFSAGLQVYWIAGGLWMVIQSIITHKLIIKQSKNRKHKKIKA